MATRWSFSANKSRCWRWSAWLPLCLLLACSRGDAPQRAAQLEQIHGACTTAMVASTCRIMQGQQAGQLPAGVQTILVAGVGPVDARLYRRLWQQGNAMCAHLQQQCAQDWQGGACQTARRLYLPAQPS